MPSPVQREPDVSPAEREALRLWIVLSRAHAAIAEHAVADVARHDLTIAEFGILEALYHRGRMLLGEVQRRILVSSGGVTYLVDRLVAKGYVERTACPEDRRARYAVLTRAGESLVRRIFPQHAATIAEAMSGLPAAERRALAEQLKRLGLAAARGTAHDDATAVAAPPSRARRPRSDAVIAEAAPAKRAPRSRTAARKARRPRVD
jgi:MarR family 2-MHQ and catechol resistance regulon transcriptional repressor